MQRVSNDACFTGGYILRVERASGWMLLFLHAGHFMRTLFIFDCMCVCVCVCIRLSYIIVFLSQCIYGIVWVCKCEKFNNFQEFSICGKPGNVRDTNIEAYSLSLYLSRLYAKLCVSLFEPVSHTARLMVGAIDLPSELFKYIV